MRARAVRLWVILAGLGAALAAVLDATAQLYAAAGAVLLACAVLIFRLDSQRKRGGTRR